MSETNDRMDLLEREMRRLRGWILVLGITLVATFALGATKETPDELTLRKLIIVDADGKQRIVAGTTGDEAVGLVYIDRNGKPRILTATKPDGEAGVQHYDIDGKMRIAAVTLPGGEAMLVHHDRNGKKRIVAVTLSDGGAGIGLLDVEGQSVWGETSSK